MLPDFRVLFKVQLTKTVFQKFPSIQNLMI
jgi:hypothetical protein